MELPNDRRRVRIEVVHREVRLAARLAGPDPLERRLRGVTVVDPEDRRAELAAGLAQAHAFADAQEQAGDFLVAKDEAGPGLGALVTSVDVLAVRTSAARVGMAVRGWRTGIGRKITWPRDLASVTHR